MLIENSGFQSLEEIGILTLVLLSIWLLLALLGRIFYDAH